MNGKDKCRILKDIRRQIAEENGIEWVVSECKHKGNCKGTCPKCESEVRQLEQALEIRRRRGKIVAPAGISAACLTGLTACTVDDVVDLGTEIITEIKQAAGQGRGTGTQKPDTQKPDTQKPTEPETYDLDGDVAYIPDDLMGYMEPDYLTQEPDDQIQEPDDQILIELDGEVPADYYYTADY